MTLPSLAMTLQQRRHRLAPLVESPIALWSGGSTARNFPANRLPFRASSHFLYFAGIPLEHAVIRLVAGELELYLDDPDPASVLWHGPTPTRATIADRIGADRAYPLAELATRVQDDATIAVQDLLSRQWQTEVLQRPVLPPLKSDGHDRRLVMAIVQLRLSHDALALAELRRASAVTCAAHHRGMAATTPEICEAEVRAAMESTILAANMTCAYSSIVTTHGEVLHNNHYHHSLQAGDLLLADVGAETETGWAADVTRTWPVSGHFSPTQRDLYDVVLAAHDAAIAAIAPGIEYQAIHLRAAEVLTEGLVDLGILRGNPQSLMEQNAHALFFPHGIGHLLGLDVHDMEDLGDLAGYADGRQRSQRFGLCYLRLHRPLQPGMLVTIEPGFYQVPTILQNPEQYTAHDTTHNTIYIGKEQPIKTHQNSIEMVDWQRLEQFSDVRGIRIEDDVLVTETGHEVLTAHLPTHPQAIAELVGQVKC